MEKTRSSMKKGLAKTKVDDKRVKFAVPLSSRIATPPPRSGKRVADVHSQSRPEKVSRKDIETGESSELIMVQNEIGHDISDTEEEIMNGESEMREFGSTIMTGIKNVSMVSSKLKHLDEFKIKSQDMIKNAENSVAEFNEYYEKEIVYIEKATETIAVSNKLIKELEACCEGIKLPDFTSDDFLDFEVDFPKICTIFNNLVNLIESM